MSLHPEDEKRIDAAVRWVERQQAGKGAAQPRRAVPNTPDVSVVRCTSATAADGHYPGKIIDADVNVNPATYTDGDDCWLLFPDGSVPTAGADAIYTGRLSGVWPADGLFVFLITGAIGATEAGGGGGGTTITVEDFDGTPSYATVDTLQFVQSTGFTLTEPVAGTARVFLNACTSVAPGTITACTQAGGITKFWNDVHIAETDLGGADQSRLLMGDSAHPVLTYYEPSGGTLTVSSTTLWLELGAATVSSYAKLAIGGGSAWPPEIHIQTGAGSYAQGDNGTLPDGSTVTAGLITNIGSGGGISDGDKGDVTVSASGATWTIDAGTVTYAKMQDVSAASRLLGRGDSGAGDVEEITLGTNLSMSGTTLNATAAVSDGDKGDITVSGSGATWTIDAGVVTLAKMADLAADRVIGRVTSLGAPQALTITNVLDMASATDWAVPYRNTVSWGALNPNTTATRKFFSMTGTGAAGQAPAWSAVEAADLPHLHDFTDGTPVPTDRFPFYSGSASANRDCALSDITAAAQAPLVILQDQKASGTEGGTFTQGAAGVYRTRDLNTEVTDTGAHCTLASNQFTLSAGTWKVRVSAPAFNVYRHQCRIYNATDGVQVLLGAQNTAGATDTTQTASTIDGVFTIGSGKALEIQHWCQQTMASQGFGVAGSNSTEIYTRVNLEKIG
jgi:hypothetical protein